MANMSDVEKPHLEARSDSEKSSELSSSNYASTNPSDVDEALRVYRDLHGEKVQYTEAQAKRVLWKIDFIMLPVMCTVYGLQFLDKTTLSYASITGITKDLKLTTNQYNWLGSLFYFGMF